MKSPSAGKGLSPGKLAWRRFRRNLLAVGGGVFLILCILCGIFSYLIMPDATRNANLQALEFARKPPGTKVYYLLRPRERIQEEKDGFFTFLAFGKPEYSEPIPLLSEHSFSVQNDTLYFTGQDGMKQFELLPVFLLRLDKNFRDANGKPYFVEKGKIRYRTREGHIQVSDLDSMANSIASDHILKRTFLLGSDGYGRDVLSRLILGTRVSLAVGFLAVVISLIVGVFLGAIAGFFGGWVDSVVMWFTSVIWSIPTVLLAVSLTFIWEKGFWQIFIAIGLSMWVEVARMVRGQILSVREMQYVEAAKTMGYSSFRQIFVHILPNILNPVIIIAAANFATAILVEAGLSFLGVGVQPPVPSWGGMIREGYTYIIFDSGKWLAIFPETKSQ